MTEWIPLFQSLVWPVVLCVVLVWARKPLLEMLAAITGRIEEGAGLKAGPIEVTASAPKLPLSRERSGDAPAEATGRDAKDTGATEEEDQRDEDEGNPGFYIAHKARRDRRLDRREYEYYRLQIYLEWDPGVDDSAVRKVIYHLPEGFPVRDPEVKDPSEQYEYRTSAWGQFNLTADVYLVGRDAPLRLQRYLNF